MGVIRKDRAPAAARSLASLALCRLLGPAANGISRSVRMSLLLLLPRPSRGRAIRIGIVTARARARARVRVRGATRAPGATSTPPRCRAWYVDRVASQRHPPRIRHALSSPSKRSTNEQATLARGARGARDPGSPAAAGVQLSKPVPMPAAVSRSSALGQDAALKALQTCGG